MNAQRFGLLMKKQMLDAVPFLSRKNRRIRLDFASAFLAILLLGIIVFAIVFVYGKFVETYAVIKINRVLDIEARHFEIMSVTYLAVGIILTITGLNGLSHALFEDDLRMLLPLPFSSSELFFSRALAVYAKQVAVTLFLTISTNVTFMSVTDMFTLYGLLMTVFSSLLIPMISLGVSSILVLPYHYIKTILASHHLTSFAVITVLLLGFGLLYARAFDLVQSLIVTGRITSLFDEGVMTSISSIALHNYPFCFIAELVLRRKVLVNLLLVVAVCLVNLVVAFFVVRALFFRVTHAQIVVHMPKLVKRTSIPNKLRVSPFTNLIKKEFLTVLQTPSYTYMYLATACVMPLMCFYSARICIEMLSSLVGGLDVGFEICTFVVLLFGTLTDTFCSTNISRDGNMAIFVKMLPCTRRQVLTAKIVFCAIISVASIGITTIVLTHYKFETLVQGLITFASALLLSLARTVIATRIDLAHPHFSKVSDSEIKEPNSTVSSIIFIGMAVSFLVGISLLLNAVKGLSGDVSAAGRVMCALVIPAALFVASLFYFHVGLQKAYDNLDVEA